MTLSNMKLKEAGDFMDPSQYTIRDTNGTDLTSTNWPHASTTGRIVITFTNPKVIAGTGIEFSLRSVVSGAIPGDSVSVGFTTKGTSTVVTGYLTSDYATTTLSSVQLIGPNLNLTTAGNTTADAPGTFVWSDRSETSPGSATSGDWTDDLYVRRLDTVAFTR